MVDIPLIFRVDILQIQIKGISGLWNRLVYLFGMVYYYVIGNYVIDSPIGIWPLFLYCFLLAVPGDIALCILGAALGRRIIPVLGIEVRRNGKQATAGLKE